MASPFLPLAPEVGIEMGPNAVLVEDETGGRVYLGGMLAFAWDADDEATRALAAVLLVEGQAASQQDVAFAFGVSPVTVWRWGRDKAAGGVAALSTPNVLQPSQVPRGLAVSGDERALVEW